MAKVTLDAEASAKLNGLRESVMVYDAAGRLLGKFQPAPPEPSYSEEELQRRENQPG